MANPLPSCKDSAATSAVLDFVARVTKERGPDFVPPSERIATFDNDGTLWCEQPMQVQFFFLIDRVKQLAAENPALKDHQPHKTLLEHGLKALHEEGRQGLMELAFATHAGVSEDVFDEIAKSWFATARHPTLGRPFYSHTYQPQVELLAEYGITVGSMKNDWGAVFSSARQRDA